MKEVLNKIQEFIKRYYFNQIIRGAIWLVVLLIIMTLLISGVEYFAWMGRVARSILFFGFIGVSLFLLWRNILIPVLRLVGIRSGISEVQAANMIGRHFPEISDKLLNVLQLSEKSKAEDNSLLIAAIDQKAKSLKPFDFRFAVNLSENKKYLKYFFPSVSLFIAIVIIDPGFIKDPALRISQYNKEFVKPAPFNFVIENSSFNAMQNEDFRLRVTTEGEEIPEEIFVETNGLSFKMQKTELNQFEYLFKKLSRDQVFYLSASLVQSEDYTINVVPKPVVTGFKVLLDYPAYTGKADEEIKNVGDLIVPRGTKAKWIFNARNASNLEFMLDSNRIEPTLSTNGRFEVNSRLLASSRYEVKVANEKVDSLPSMNYKIEVVMDEFPAIQVMEVRDSLNEFFLYFSGEIADDYGFSNLKFASAVVSGSDTAKYEFEKLAFSNSLNRQFFYHTIDVREYDFEEGDKLIYFFEVTDNDAISGGKKSRTYQMVYEKPGLSDLEENDENLEKNIEKEFEDILQKSRNLKSDLEDLDKELLNKKELDWNDKQKIEELIEKQLEIKKDIEKLQKNQEFKNEKEQTFKEFNESVLEKQKQLEDLMNKLLDEETLKMLEELQKMLDELNKKDVEKMMEQMKMNTDELEKELDRNLELFKQFELEKDLLDAMDKLEELQKKQEELSQETKEKGADKEELQQKQKELNEEFDQIEKKLDDIKEKNKELEQPHNFKDTKPKQDEINQEMNNSLQQLQNNKKSMASKSQKGAAQKMKELSDQLSDMQSEMGEEQDAEDIDALRQILENLIQLSFDQEQLINKVKSTSRQNPLFQDLISEQKKLKDDFKIIEDSLTALSKRQITISSVVNKELASINENMNRATDFLLDLNTVGVVRNDGKSRAMEKQQFSMTSLNTLSLLLAESLDQMMKQMNQNKSGKGKNCKKPNSSGNSMQKIRKMQEKLNSKMQQLKKDIENGKVNQNGRNSMNEQFARMAAEQEAIRRAVQEYLDELKEQGLDDKGNLSKLMQEMEKTEEELVNKILNNQTLKRQENIRTRLLDSEKAERKRDQEEKRQATEAKNQFFGNPEAFLEYNRLRSKEHELLRYSKPHLKPFYKSKVNDYLINQDN